MRRTERREEEARRQQRKDIWFHRSLSLLVLVAFGFVLNAFAQNPPSTTLVSGTVTDVNSLAYAGATLKAQLVVNGAPVSGQPTVTVNSASYCQSAGLGSAPCKVPFIGVQTAQLSSSGSFQVYLQDNTLVLPASTQWLLTVTSGGAPPPLGTGPQICAATLTISGSTQSVTSSFTSCPALSNITGGGGGGGSPAVGPAGTLQSTDGAGHLTVSGQLDKGTIFSTVRDSQFSGPNPSFDLRAFGGYISTSTTTMTCSIAASSSLLSCASNPDFLDASGIQGSSLGHGVMVPGAGSLPTLTTPSAPTITPNLSGGSTVWNYKLIAEDYKGGLTAASAAGTTSSGSATLGVTQITVTSASRSAGVTTYTTSAAHNLSAGSEVLVCGFGGAGCPGPALDNFNGKFVVAATPTSTTFTVVNGNAPDQSESTGTGVANTLACNTGSFPAASFSGVGTLRYWIYRSQGAGAYSLASVVVGLDPYFVDCGAAPTNVPAYIPATPPASAQAGFLATTISGGGGTTSMTLAAAAGTSVSNVTVQHDNSTNLIAALTAASGQGGGTVYIPSVAANGSSAVFWPFTATTNLTTVPTITSSSADRILINGYVGVNQPWILRGNLTIEGETKRVSSFMYVGGAQVGGTAYPILYATTVTSLALKNLLVNTLGPLQTAFFTDNDNNGQGSTGIVVNNVDFAGNSVTGFGQAHPVILKGGFDYKFTDVVCDPGAGGSTLLPQSCLKLANSSTATFNGNSQIPGRFSCTRCFFTATGASIVATAGNAFTAALGYEFTNVLSEAFVGPELRINAPGLVSGIRISGWDDADRISGFGTPLIEGEGTNTLGTIYWNSGSASNLYQPIAIGNANTATLSAVFPPTSNLGNIPSSNMGSQKTEFTSLPANETGGTHFNYSLGLPGAPVGCAVAAGGSAPIGTLLVQLEAIDFDGFETPVGPSVSVTTTTGNQLINCSTPAVPTGGAGFAVYVNGARWNVGTGCTLPQLTGAGTAFQISGTNCSNSASPVNQAGSSFIGPNGVTSYQVEVTGPTNFSSVEAFPVASGNRQRTVPDQSGVEQVTPNPSGPAGMAQVLTYIPGTDPANGAGSFKKPGLAAIEIATNTDSITSADCTPRQRRYTGNSNVTVTLPDATTLQNTSCTFTVVNKTTGTNTTVQFNPATWQINGQASFTLQLGQQARISVNQAGTAWNADVSEATISAGTNITLARSASGVTVSASGSGSGCTQTIANATSGGTTVNQFAKLSASPQGMVNTGTADTRGALGVVTAGAGTSGSATIQTCGQASAVADGAVAFADWLVQSTSNPGHVQSAGGSFPTTQQVLAQALQASAGGSSIVQQVSSPLTPASTSKVITVPSATGGDTGVVIAQGFNGNTISACQDNLGTNWNVAPAPSGGASACYLVGLTAGITSVTVTLGTSNTYNLQYYELGGVTGFCTSGFATTTVPTVTTSGNQCQNNSLYLAFVGNQNGSGAITPTTTGYTSLLSSNCCSGNQALAAQWRSVTSGSGSPVTYAPTSAPNTQAAGILVFNVGGTATINVVLQL